MNYCLALALLLSVAASPTRAQDLATSPAVQLLQVYHQLRSIQGSDEAATLNDVAFRRDAATFTFSSGTLTFATPIAGHVTAAVFGGNATFELDPPTTIERDQIARFSGGQPKLAEAFDSAVFFFTDDSYASLEKVGQIRPVGNRDAATNELHKIESRYQGDFNDWWSNQAKRNPTMCNLAARMLADLSDPKSKGFFLADIKSSHAGRFIFLIDWNRDQVLFPSSADKDDEMLIHYDQGQSYAWWSGFDSTADGRMNSVPPPGTRHIHCTNETIDATISSRNTLSATVRMNFQVERGAPRVLPFNLNPVLRISSITDAQGKPLSFIQEPRNEDSDPWVILPESAKPDTQYTVIIAYQENSDEHSRIIRGKGQGLFYVAPEESWYPHFGALGDWATFDSIFHSPSGYQLIGPGQPVAVKNQDSTEWKTPVPFGAAGFMFGTLNGAPEDVGGLRVTHYVPVGIPTGLYDEAQEEAAKRANGGIDQPILNNGEIGLSAGSALLNECYRIHPPGPIEDEAATLFQFFFGPLNIKHLSVVATPFPAFGMNWPMAEVAPFNPLSDPATLICLGRSGGSESGGSPFYELPTVRAIALQWWGGQMEPKTYHDDWLFEGLTELSQALFIGQFDSKHWATFWNTLSSTLLTRAKDGHRLIDASPVWLGDQATPPSAATVLDGEKGAYILQTLRMLMQIPNSKDPDAAFVAMMKDFTNTYAGRDASTADFQTLVEKHIGQPMGWFFDEWVYGTAVPHYDFKYNLSAAPGGKTQLAMTITQSDVPDTFRMLVPIYVTREKGTFELALVTLKGSSTVSPQVMLPFRPLKVELDATHSILCTINQ